MVVGDIDGDGAKQSFPSYFCTFILSESVVYYRTEYNVCVCVRYGLVPCQDEIEDQLTLSYPVVRTAYKESKLAANSL